MMKEKDSGDKEESSSPTKKKMVRIDTAKHETFVNPLDEFLSDDLNETEIHSLGIPHKRETIKSPYKPKTPSRFSKSEDLES